MSELSVKVAHLLALIAASLLLGGCISMEHQPQRAHDNSVHNSPAEHLAPLSDDAAKAQVVDAARQIVAVAHLQGVAAGFAFDSCNDQGDPPYMGSLQLVFDLPADTNSDAYFQKILSAMKTGGWSTNTRYQFGPKRLDKGGVTAEIAPLAGNPGKGRINIYGECRNMTDHHHDGRTNPTDVTSEVL
jgi:outer membrane murein-binding lipoprotein Lpp